MSLESAKRHLEKFGLGAKVMEFGVSSATVALAARALGVEPGRIAKTVAFYAPGGGAVLVVASGDMKIDSPKFKRVFGAKPKMLSPADVAALTGHEPGGVCPFANPEGAVVVRLDVSLNRFSTVFPACGSANSAIELSCEELLRASMASGWVDVCKPINPPADSIQKTQGGPDAP